MGYSLSYEKILELDDIAHSLCRGSCDKCKGKAECKELRRLDTEITTIMKKFNTSILSEKHIPKELKGCPYWMGTTLVLGKVDVALSKHCSGDCKSCEAQDGTWCYRVCQKANNYNDKVYKLMTNFIEKNKRLRIS